MIVTANTNAPVPSANPWQPQATALTQGVASAPSISAAAQISPAGSLLDSLYEEANRFIQKEHIEPFTAYIKGNVTPGAYLDIRRYNDYIFDKAAAIMVQKAADAGISVNKDDLVEQTESLQQRDCRAPSG